MHAIVTIEILSV